MAKRAKKIVTSEGLSLKIVNPNAAGIDISTTEMQVCVPADRDGENNRRLGCFTKDLHDISSYLQACAIDTVAMESTGIYWLPSYDTKERWFDIILVNPVTLRAIMKRRMMPMRVAYAPS